MKKIARIALRNIATLFHNNEIEKIKTGFLELFSFLRVDNNRPLYLKKAGKWYHKSLQLVDSQSAYQLGWLYENNFYGSINDKIKENKNKAENCLKWLRGLKMLEDTAEKGLDMGQTYLGEFYEKKKQNLKEAVEFYSMAARQKRGYYSHAAYHQLNKLKGKGLINKDVVIKDIFEYHRNECKYETEEKFEKIL
ncbi:hypothetical protein GLOIN_2v1481253 [Rhizophagus clarus]|uniref:Sel1 repeat family protein n=1 Tax=Rhizophagus clarus TaxID=94130 RepID=A0A8H3LVX6_9GLOM|nr:hypothetical protein GLOIN_2v1481253 [Rhizophagus clarus]